MEKKLTLTNFYFHIGRLSRPLKDNELTFHTSMIKFSIKEVMKMNLRVVLLAILLVSSLWAGEIALDLRDIFLHDVINSLAQQAKEEIIQGSDLAVKITATIKCSTLEEALKALSVLHPRLRWVKLSFPAKEKISREDIILTAMALQSVKISRVVASWKDEAIFFSKGARASLGDKELRTVYVVWEEGPSILNMLSAPQVRLTPQDYLNLNWMMLNAFLSMTPEERKQVLFGSFNMVLQDPALLQRMMQESFATMMTLTPEEMGKLIGASLQAMQSIPPEFWQQMMQSMGQLMQQMGPQFPGMMPPMGGVGQ